MKYVLPRSLRDLILSSIHEGHLGILKSRVVKKTCVVASFDCIQNNTNPKSPLHPKAFPKWSCSVVSADIAFDKNNYLVAQDCSQ